MCLVMRALVEAGADVDIVYPVNHPVDLSHVRVEHDLYVWRKMSGLAFSLAGALHRLGAALVNPYPASAALQDKIVTSRILQAAGVPTPATYVASRAEELAPLLDAGPLPAGLILEDGQPVTIGGPLGEGLIGVGVPAVPTRLEDLEDDEDDEELLEDEDLAEVLPIPD